MVLRCKCCLSAPRNVGSDLVWAATSCCGVRRVSYTVLDPVTRPPQRAVGVPTRLSLLRHHHSRVASCTPASRASTEIPAHLPVYHLSPWRVQFCVHDLQFKSLTKMPMRQIRWSSTQNASMFVVCIFAQLPSVILCQAVCPTVTVHWPPRATTAPGRAHTLCVALVLHELAPYGF